MGQELIINIERVDMHSTCWQSYVWFAQHPDGIREITRAKTKAQVIEDVRKLFPDHNIKLVKKKWLDW